MPIETGLVSYAALTVLALAMKKHRAQVAAQLLPSPRAARIAGWAMLALSAAAAVAHFGPAVGVAAWVGQLCLAGAALALLLSWRPRLAPAFATLALAGAALASLSFVAQA